MKLPFKVRFEQAVYGTFPFWHRGYGVLAHSAGCRPEWLAELRTVCQRFGEPPAGGREADAIFALRLERGPVLIAGVHPQGRDDQERPGALRSTPCLSAAGRTLGQAPIRSHSPMPCGAIGARPTRIDYCLQFDGPSGRRPVLTTLTREFNQSCLH